MTRPNLRELRKKRTHHDITVAAYHLFTDQGFDATSMDDIARRAEVGLRTLYRYYPTKLDIVTPGRTALRDTLAGLPDPGPAIDLNSALSGPVRQIAAWLDSLAGQDAALISLAARDPAIRSALTTVIDDMTGLVAHHLTRAGTGLDAPTAQLAAAMAIAGMFAGSDTDQNHQYIGAADRAVDLLVRGLAPDQPPT